MWAAAAYPSLKPLSSWVKDLVYRIHFIEVSSPVPIAPVSLPLEGVLCLTHLSPAFFLSNGYSQAHQSRTGCLGSSSHKVLVVLARGSVDARSTVHPRWCVCVPLCMSL